MAKMVKEEIIEDEIQLINQAANSGEVIVLSSDSDEEDLLLREKHMMKMIWTIFVLENHSIGEELL